MRKPLIPDFGPAIPEAFNRLLFSVLGSLDAPPGLSYSQWEQREDDVERSVWLCLLELEGFSCGALTYASSFPLEGA